MSRQIYLAKNTQQLILKSTNPFRSLLPFSQTHWFLRHWISLTKIRVCFDLSYYSSEPVFVDLLVVIKYTSYWGRTHYDVLRSMSTYVIFLLWHPAVW
jgi:hypothetical protein